MSLVASLEQQQGREHAAQAAIAVLKRMDGKEDNGEDGDEE